MAHIENFSRGAVGGIVRHDERTQNDGVHSRKNESIVPERTHLNYNLAPKRHGTVLEHIKYICERDNIRLNNRKDLNIMSSWVITKPESITPEEQEKFFKECYNFLSNRYGENSVITASVHLDETTPHMHFGFIPIAYDKKNNRYTVSAKLRINRKELQTFHTDLNNHMSRVFRRDIGITNGVTASLGGNKSKAELVKMTLDSLIEQQIQQQSIIEENIQKLSSVQNNVLSQQELLEKCNEEIQVKQKQLETIQEVINQSQVLNSQLSKQIDELQAEKEKILTSTDELNNFTIKSNLKLGKFGGGITVKGIGEYQGQELILMQKLENTIDVANKHSELSKMSWEEFTDLNKQKDENYRKKKEQEHSQMVKNIHNEEYDKAFHQFNDEIQHLKQYNQNLLNENRMLRNALNIPLTLSVVEVKKKLGITTNPPNDVNKKNR